MDREEIIGTALDILDNTDATLEEAMGMALESSYHIKGHKWNDGLDPKVQYDLNYLNVKKVLGPLIDQWHRVCESGNDLKKPVIEAKIAKLAARPDLNYQLKASGCWGWIPKEIKERMK